MLKRILFPILISAHFALSSTALAQQADPIANQIEFIQQSLNDEATHSFIWQLGWTAATGISTAVDVVGYRKERIDKHKKYDHGVGMITSGIGFVDMLVTPLLGYRYANELEEMPEQTRAEKKFKLQMAEKWLEKAAQRQQEKRNWQAHAGSVLVNGLGAAAIAFDDKREEDGLMFFAIGMLASEIKIFTSPNNLTDALNNYRNHYTAKTYKQENYWQLSSQGRNLNLSYHF